MSRTRALNPLQPDPLAALTDAIRGLGGADRERLIRLLSEDGREVARDDGGLGRQGRLALGFGDGAAVAA